MLVDSIHYAERPLTVEALTFTASGAPSPLVVHSSPVKGGEGRGEAADVGPSPVL